jgi:hypothetical protein
MKLLIMYFLQPPVTLSVLGQRILNTLFSDTRNLCSSLNVRDRNACPYKATCMSVSSHQGHTDFSLHHHFQNGSKAYQEFYPLCTGVSF